MVKRVLVVDDDRAIVGFLKDELSRKLPELDIIAAESGFQALTHVLSGGIDLLITDIAMPDLDGYELFSRAREQNSQLPVIMMTGFGYDPNHTIVRAREDGLRPNDIVFKPFDAEIIIQLIKEHLKE
ncbi:MAG: response regulator [Candidatus Cloacimonadia bacterium]